MLELEDVTAGYGETLVLHNVSLNFPEGSLIALVGANAAGKSTMARVISGLIPLHAGHIKYMGDDLGMMAPYERVRHGIVHVPEGRCLFPFLNVEETLVSSSSFGQPKANRSRNIDLCYAMFPRLHERRKQLASTMSGGEQQMLAIARGLMSEPKFLILDEPSLGLAPKMVEQIFAVIKELRKQNMAILLIEQHLKEALSLCDYAYVIENGQIVLQGIGAELLVDARTREAYLGKFQVAGSPE